MIGVVGVRNHCCLCGILLRGLKRRFQRPKDVGEFVHKFCKPTPFLYPFLSAMSVGGSDALLQVPPRRRGSLWGICIPCVNWKRRVETSGLKRVKQPMLQLDQLICFLMQPGQHMEPDYRCMERLLQAARQSQNPFKGLFPSPVQSILERVEKDTFQCCVLAWWEYNGRTEFFSSGQEARRVRCAVKAVEDGFVI